MIDLLTRPVKRFATDTNAAVAMETVIIFPFLVWAWIGAFTFFDAYRVYNTSIKATYTVADLLSRQDSEVLESDADGMAVMLAAMIRDTDNVMVRFTQVLRTPSMEYIVDCAHATGTLAELSTANLVAIQDQLPDMAAGERIMIVESFIDYDPAFDFGLNDLVFENFTLTRPRAPQIPCADWNDDPNVINVHDDGAG